MSTTTQLDGAVIPETTRPPLRVLVVCHRYFPELGGIETHVYEVLKRLSRNSAFTLTLLTTDLSGKLPEEEVIDGVTVLRVPAWPRNRDYYLAPRIPAVVGQPGRWDLVHCQGIHNLVPLLSMTAARRAGIPYVVSFHTGGHSKRWRNAVRSTQWRVIGPLLRGASRLIGVSRFEAETVARPARLAEKRVTVIRNGGTLPLPPVKVSPVPGRIVSSGRLERYKGHHRVIEALPEIIRLVPEAHLRILGSGPYEGQLRELAARLGVGDRVTITSIAPADRAAMGQALTEASVIAALSEYEAHPIAVMEALSVGRPVVGFDIAGIGELVGEGWVQGVDPKEKPVGIARQLVTAMSTRPSVDPGDLPTWDTCAAQLGEVYLEIGERIRRGELGRRMG
jgi:glycosyltransferase involved in cell wall biosynthesis